MRKTDCKSDIRKIGRIIYLPLIGINYTYADP